MPIKLMAASRRRPGLTRAEYFRYIEHYHGTVARLERFKIEKYIQNHVIDGAFGVLSDADGHKNKVADRDAVVELHFDSFRDMLATLEPEGVTTSRADVHDVASLVQEVDARLYQAKQGGRDRVVPAPLPA